MKSIVLENEEKVSRLLGYCLIELFYVWIYLFVCLFIYTFIIVFIIFLVIINYHFHF